MWARFRECPYLYQFVSEIVLLSPIYVPIRSMYGIYLPTFIIKDQPNVGKHTSPMDPTGMRYL